MLQSPIRKNNSRELKEYPVPKHVNTSMLLDDLLADEEYIFWVKTFPMINNVSMVSIGYEYSENVTLRTYAEPGDLTLINATSTSLNISVPRGIDRKR